MPVTKEITVIDELRTLEKLQDGYSIARYGDGELDLAFGKRDAVFENQGADLAARLREVLVSGLEKLLIGVPNIFSAEAKDRLCNPAFWKKYEDNFLHHLEPGKIYYSAFITRPDNVAHRPGQVERRNRSAPEDVEPAYWDRLKNLWEGKAATIVHFDAKTMEHPLYQNASSRNFVPCEQRDAWGANGENYRLLLDSCLKAESEIILASVGPVATILAHDLCQEGRQCIDLGQATRVYQMWRGLEHMHLY